MLNEATIIKTLARESDGFIGDDAAVLPLPDGFRYVLTNDVLVEDIHFRTRYFSPKDLAHKALHVNLSDLAAMGASPKYILCGISIPISKGDYAEAFLHHLLQACKDVGVRLIGGDTTRSPDKLYISITAVGAILKRCIKFRSTACEGDIICVAGDLGWAHLGLRAFEQSVSMPKIYQNACLLPQAKIQEGIWLGKQPYVTSMMDVSDGLYIDLRRLCEASSVGAVIHLERFGLDEQFIRSCQSLELEPIEVILTGGEDYNLLFTVQPKYFEQLALNFEDSFKYPIKVIGHILADSRVIFRQNNEIMNLNLNLKSFTHFGEENS